MKFLKRLLHLDEPPRTNKYGETICYCGNKTFGQSFVGLTFYTVTCRKCGHWWWE
jgi:hypothetical protein